jgi:hypothetical protein
MLTFACLKKVGLVSVLWIRIRIRMDPHHLAGSGILDVDPDLRLQNWHLINLFSVENYCEQNLNTSMLTF